MNLIFENHKNGNGGFISLKNEIRKKWKADLYDSAREKHIDYFLCNGFS